MTFWLVLALPALLSIWNLLMSRSFGTILLTAAGMVLCVIGAWRRSERPVIAGLLCLLIAYGGALVGSEASLQLWTGLAYGLGIFLTMELSFDLRRIAGRRDSPALWEPRRRYLLAIAASVVIGGFVLGILAVSFAPGLAGRTAPLVFWVGGIGVVVVAAASAMMLRFWVRDERSGS